MNMQATRGRRACTSRCGRARRRSRSRQTREMMMHSLAAIAVGSLLPLRATAAVAECYQATQACTGFFERQAGCNEAGKMAVERRLSFSPRYMYTSQSKTDDEAVIVDSTQLDRFVDTELQKAGLNVAAFSAVGIQGGKIAWSKVAGMADYNRSVPVTAHTRFMWASVSKTVISYAVMLLFDRELVELDQDVSDYVGYRVQHPDHPGIPITLRMLMTHMAGINDAHE